MLEICDTGDGGPSSFQVQYAGLVRDIRGDIDPSGRTDLLKILDRAKIKKQIESFDETNKFAANAVLQIDLCSITIRSTFENELLLYVPIHLIASVGFIREACEYILPIKVGYSSARNRDFFDLAVLYCETTDVAETICNVLGQCFSQVYKEIASNFETSAAPKKTPTISSVSPPSNHRPLFLTESHQDLRISSGHPPCSTTASHSESAEIQIDDVIEDYMVILTKCLTTSELSQFATLIVRFRNGSMPIIELAQKSSELYGPNRLHLLTDLPLSVDCPITLT
ncbi:Cerebral cavernous malformations 2 protein [Dirofilaria immitis]